MIDENMPMGESQHQFRVYNIIMQYMTLYLYLYIYISLYNFNGISMKLPRNSFFHHIAQLTHHVSNQVI